ncbi:MAG: signal peptidase II [Chloroflexota bacterium]|nr:signal peptidase II [Chloroflexota bacterium]
MRGLYFRLFVLIALTLGIDQATKRLVIDNLHLGETFRPIPALAPYFQITRSFNTGAAFGIFPQSGVLFTLIAVGVVIMLIALYPRFTSGAARVGIGLVCGGALGNVIDRVTYNAVVDFIHYQIPGVISNVSNLADHAIVFGVLIIVADSWRRDSKPAADELTPTDDAKPATIRIESNPTED